MAIERVDQAVRRIAGGLAALAVVPFPWRPSTIAAAWQEPAHTAATPNATGRRIEIRWRETPSDHASPVMAAATGPPACS